MMKNTVALLTSLAMKKKLYIAALCLMTIAQTSHCAHRTAEAHRKNPNFFTKYNSALIKGSKLHGLFGQFYKSKNLPYNTEVILDAHVSELKKFLDHCINNDRNQADANTCKKVWLPGYWIKYGVDRVRNAEKLKTTIQEQNLNLITVAEKYLYHIPGTPEQLTNENYLVIAENVSSAQGEKKLSLEYAEQLCKAILHAKYYDLHTGNYILQKNGKLTIIDTDSTAMPSEEEIRKIESRWIEKGFIMEHSTCRPTHPFYYLRLDNHEWGFDTKAREYIMDQIKKCEEKRSGNPAIGR